MKPIPHTIGYFADIDGNIYSINYKRSKTPADKPLKMRIQTSANGYKTVGIRFKGEKKYMLVSYLVLLTFVGERPSKNHHACHGANGKADNSLSNLYWATISQNNKEDKDRDGSRLTENGFNGSRKLTTPQVKEIRKLAEMGVKISEISRLFNTDRSNVHLIIKRKTWNHC